MKQDSERALKVCSHIPQSNENIITHSIHAQLLTSKETSKRKDKHEDDIAMLQQFQEENPIAGAQFLEHLVLQKRSLVKNLDSRDENF